MYVHIYEVRSHSYIVSVAAQSLLFCEIYSYIAELFFYIGKTKNMSNILEFVDYVNVTFLIKSVETLLYNAW